MILQDVFLREFKRVSVLNGWNVSAPRMAELYKIVQNYDVGVFHEVMRKMENEGRFDTVRFRNLMSEEAINRREREAFYRKQREAEVSPAFRGDAAEREFVSGFFRLMQALIFERKITIAEFLYGMEKLGADQADVNELWAKWEAKGKKKNEKWQLSAWEGFRLDEDSPPAAVNPFEPQTGDGYDAF